MTFLMAKKITLSGAAGTFQKVAAQRPRVTAAAHRAPAALSGKSKTSRSRCAASE